MRIDPTQMPAPKKTLKKNLLIGIAAFFAAAIVLLIVASVVPTPNTQSAGEQQTQEQNDGTAEETTGKNVFIGTFDVTYMLYNGMDYSSQLAEQQKNGQTPTITFTEDHKVSLVNNGQELGSLDWVEKDDKTATIILGVFGSTDVTYDDGTISVDYGSTKITAVKEK